MNFIYFLFHGFVHLFLIFLIFLVFRLEFFQVFLIFLASALVDLDHIPLIKKKGIKHWIKIWSSHSSQIYPFHNFLSLILSFLLSFLLLSSKLFIVGICFLSVFLHLFWDFFEDVFILKIGIKHWKV